MAVKNEREISCTHAAIEMLFLNAIGIEAFISI